ncbi:MAG: DUF1385 domain-containing protein [Oscillospiraceae bacterium]|nr:DUF1385 domain-containing protein [Oscillospiraceae bacterium]
MAKHSEKKNDQEKFKTLIGGQALIEGILMRGPEKQAIVVRSPEGLVKKIDDLRLTKKRAKILSWPLIRGVVTFGASMVNGVKALLFSAEYFPEEEENAEPGKLEKWIEKKFGSEKLEQFIIYSAVVLGIAFSVGLFFLLPTFLSGLIPGLRENYLARNLTEGALKIVLFLGYMILVSQTKDMKRVFAYHGAEHKSIRCYEARLPLTVDNVRPMSRFHPRCGTSFLLVVVCISILCGAVIRVSNTLARMGLHLLMLPVIVAVSYELNRFLGRHDNAFTRIIMAPGLWMQRFTTQEPDDSMMEVAIEALTAVLPEEEGADQW